MTFEEWWEKQHERIGHTLGRNYGLVYQLCKNAWLTSSNEQFVEQLNDLRKQVERLK